MTAYYMNEAMFDLPDAEFVDRTVTYLRGTGPSGAEVVLLVERKVLPEDTTLREAVMELGKKAKEHFRGYTALFEREVEVASHPAIDVGARWREEDGSPVYTRRVHLTLGTSWLIIAGEGAFADRAFCDAHIEQIVGSLQFRE